MTDIKIDLKNIQKYITPSQLESYQDEVEKQFSKLYTKDGKGNDFLGWIDLPSMTDTGLLDSIDSNARKINQMAEIYVVIGIGGSYLGARAMIEALQHHFEALRGEREHPYVVFAGNHISEDYMADLISILDKKDYALSVVSKSGTTTEPAIAFRILKNHLEHKYGKEGARERIIAITDKEKGALKNLADKEGYETYVVPDDVGGRYSVLTPVGLLPIAVSGIDIRKLIDGANSFEVMSRNCWAIGKNPAATYAAARNLLYAYGKTTEIMVNYEPSLFYFTEWWKQLYGESEGKENKGIFPAGVSNTSDLHSMGQYIQEGLRNMFETVISVEKGENTIKVPKVEEDSDGLNYIAGKRMQYVNHMAELGTSLAHVDGGVPNIRIVIPEINEYTLGQLIYFFEIACGVSGYLLGVNPFDQPGVEAYKKNMFALLGKPGFEKETEEIKSKISE